MNQDLIDAAMALADTLARENEALTRLDLARAAAMLGAKRRAAADFEQARTKSAGAHAPSQPRLMQSVEHELAALAEENRVLLARAIGVQKRVIGTVAAALPRAPAGGGYRADGALAKGGKMPAFALLERA
ncbi:MAG: hypothetical protein ACREF0_04495 [Acetobacteraceae bacterium]